MKYIITWDYGYGTNYDVVEAVDYKEAEKIAYEQWREGAESIADYGVEGEATEELLEEYGLDK